MQSISRIPLTRILAWLILCTSGLSGAHADNRPDNRPDNRLSSEAIINLPIADAWTLFTTEAGLESMGYTQARVDLRLGGSLQASGAATPLPGLNSEVISLDAGHMLSFKPVASATQAEWTVLYLTAMGKDMTQLRWLEIFPANQQTSASKRQQQVRQLFDQLIRRYAPECEVCKQEKAGVK